MKIKAGYVLREVADQIIVVPTGQAAINFNGVITLNKSGKLLWETLTNNVSFDDLVNVLLEKYEVSKEQASRDVLEFLETLRKHNILDEQ